MTAFPRLGILAAAAALGAAEAPRPPAGLPPGTLLLLAAPWCAPCWDELKRLDGIAAAASQLQLRVMMMEDGPRARAMLREVPAARRWLPPVGEAAALRAALWARTPGLPLALATDGRGGICAERGGGLRPEQAREMVRTCGMHP